MKAKQIKGPVHIAIIPDGNRRWAKKKGLPLLKGHEKGINNIRNLMNWVNETDIKYISLWGFSTENFLRDPREVKGLFKLFNTKMLEVFESHNKNKNEMKFRVRFIGNFSKFPASLIKQMKKMEKTFSKGERQVNIFLGYGGRMEILNAVNRIADDIRKGKLKAKKISELVFSSYLYTKGIPDPDLVIRTSGEMRLSGLMPWQAVYSELYFSKKLWPDFNKREFFKILNEYKGRKRRFGK